VNPLASTMSFPFLTCVWILCLALASALGHHFRSSKASSDQVEAASTKRLEDSHAEAPGMQWAVLTANAD